MVFVDTIIKDNDKEIFSKEKIAILLFENMCNLGEPNLNLAEKLAFLICDRVNAKFSKEIPYDKLDEFIKEILHEENQIDLLEAYIYKKNIPEKHIQDDSLKNEIFKQLLHLSEANDVSTKLINMHSQLNILQNNQYEKLNKRIFEYIREGIFFPSSTFLRELSLNQHLVSGYSFKIEDSIESIFETLSISSISQKHGASISIDLSNIRSEKENVNSINRNACGPVKIIDLFLSAKSMVGYKTNSSNNLFYISIEHPDILSFLNVLKENIAVLIPDRFMENLEKNEDYYLESFSGRKNKISPISLLDLISSKILTNQKINLIFIDSLNKKNPLLDNEISFSISSVGLQPVFEGSSFSSGVIDVSKLVNILGTTKTFDWSRLKTIIWEAIEFLDNSLDLTKTLNDTHTQKIKDTRQVYLSITGFYSLLSKLDIKYDSDEAIFFADILSDYINYYSKLRSTELAKEKGPFFKFIKSKYELPTFSFDKQPIQKTLFSNDLSAAKKFIKNMPSVDWSELRNNIKKYGLRNSTTFSVIFSDFISFSNKTTNALCPLLSYKQTENINAQKFEYINKELLQYAPDIKTSWSNQEIESSLSDTLKLKFPLAKNISSSFFIRLQSVFEKNTDGCTNLKIYLDDNVTINDIKKLIIETHKIGNILFIPEKLNGNVPSIYDNKMSL